MQMNKKERLHAISTYLPRSRVQIHHLGSEIGSENFAVLSGSISIP